MEDPPSASTPYVSAGGGPPSNASTANIAPIGDEVAHNSPILITESPTSPPRQKAPAERPTQEGGGENQQATHPVPPQANLSLEVTRMWEPFSTKLKMMAEDFPTIISRAVESSTRKLQDDLYALRTENNTIRIEAERLSCNLTLAEIEHSRVEDAISTELQVARKEATDLRHKVQLLAQKKIELENKIVPYRVKVADLEALIKLTPPR